MPEVTLVPLRLAAMGLPRAKAAGGIAVPTVVQGSRREMELPLFKRVSFENSGMQALMRARREMVAVALGPREPVQLKEEPVGVTVTVPPPELRTVSHVAALPALTKEMLRPLRWLAAGVDKRDFVVDGVAAAEGKALGNAGGGDGDGHDGGAGVMVVVGAGAVTVGKLLAKAETLLLKMLVMAETQLPRTVWVKAWLAPGARVAMVQRAWAPVTAAPGAAT